MDNSVTKINTIYKAETKARFCGEILAMKKNIIDASDFLSELYPELSGEIASHRQVILAKLKAKLNNNIVWEQEVYSDTITLKQNVSVYRQLNPQLPKKWPNWYFRFYPLAQED